MYKWLTYIILPHFSKFIYNFTPELLTAPSLYFLPPSAHFSFIPAVATHVMSIMLFLHIQAPHWVPYFRSGLTSPYVPDEGNVERWDGSCSVGLHTKNNKRLFQSTLKIYDSLLVIILKIRVCKAYGSYYIFLNPLLFLFIKSSQLSLHFMVFQMLSLFIFY